MPTLPFSARFARLGGFLILLTASLHTAGCGCNGDKPDNPPPPEPKGGPGAGGTPGAVPDVLKSDPKMKELAALFGSENGRHWGPVRCVAFSPDGATVASGGDDAAVRVWKADTLEPASMFTGAEKPVLSVAFSSDGTRVAAGCADGAIQLWEVAKPTAPVPLKANNTGVTVLAFSPDGNWLAASGGNNIVLWNVGGPNPKQGPTLPGTSAGFSADSKYLSNGRMAWDVSANPPKEVPTDVAKFPPPPAVSPDGSRQAEWTPEFAVRLKHIDAGPFLADFTYPGHTARGQALAFSVKGDRLASASEDGTVRVWAVGDDRPTKYTPLPMPHPTRANEGLPIDLVSSADGKVMVGWYNGDREFVHIWDFDGKQAKLRTKLPWAGYGVGNYVLSADGKTLVLQQKGTERYKHNVQVVDLTANPPAVRETLTASYRASLGLSADGKTLVGSLSDKTVIVWDVNGTKFRERHTFRSPTELVSTPHVSPDGKLVAIMKFQSNLLHWDISGAEAKPLGDLPGNTAAFLPDGRSAVINSGGFSIVELGGAKPRVLATAPVVRNFSGITGLLSDGKTLLAGDCLYEATREPPVLRLLFRPGGRARSDFPDFGFYPGPGRTVLVRGKHPAHPKGGYGQLLFDFEYTKTKLQAGPTSHLPVLRAVAVGGGKVATAGSDGTVRLWRADGSELAVIRDHSGPVTAVAFSPDGKKLATGSADKTVLLWDVSGDAPKELPTYTGHGVAVRSLAFTPDGRTLAVASDDNTVRLWDLTAARPTERAKISGKLVSLGDNGKLLAAVDANGTVRLWDITGTPRETRTVYAGFGEKQAIAFSSGGTRLAFGTRDGLTVYDLTVKDPKALPVDRAKDAVSWVVFSPDGKRVAAVEGKNRVLVRDAAGKVIAEWTLPGPVNGLAFTAEGRELLTANNNGTAYRFRLPN